MLSLPVSVLFNAWVFSVSMVDFHTRKAHARQAFLAGVFNTSFERTLVVSVDDVCVSCGTFLSAVCADSCSDVNKKYEREGFEFHPDIDRLFSVTGWVYIKVNQKLMC